MHLISNQVYTLSPVNKWRIYKPETPRSSWDRYASTDYDFDKWLRIKEEDYRRALEWVCDNTSQIDLRGIHPFRFVNSGILPSRSEDCLVFLSDHGLISFMPRDGEYVSSPESPPFRPEHLLDNVDILLFSQTYGELKEMASKLGLQYHT